MKASFIIISLVLLFPRNIDGKRNGTYLLVETHDKHQGLAVYGTSPPPRRYRVSNKALSFNVNEPGQIAIKSFSRDVLLCFAECGDSPSHQGGDTLIHPI